MPAVAERFDVAHAGVRIGERQAQHGEHASVGLRQHFLRDPAVVGPTQLSLHFLLGMQADAEHSGREQARIIDAHGVHPAMAELHVAGLSGFGLLGTAQWIARDPSADILEAHLRRLHVGSATTFLAPRLGKLAQHVVLHERKNVGDVLVLVMVGIDVDDDEIVELALMRLPRRVRQ